jgi:hypothetical protein
MSLDNFNFSSYQSWSDHPTVKNAVDTINALPRYSAVSTIGNQFSVGQIECYIGNDERAIAEAKKRMEYDRCQGAKAEVLESSKEYIRNLEKYGCALRTIRDYMKSYCPSGCKCGT